MWRFQFGVGGRSHILFKRFALETSNRPVKYISNASTKNDFTTFGGGGGGGGGVGKQPSHCIPEEMRLIVAQNI